MADQNLEEVTIKIERVDCEDEYDSQNYEKEKEIKVEIEVDPSLFNVKDEQEDETAIDNGYKQMLRQNDTEMTQSGINNEIVYHKVINNIDKTKNSDINTNNGSSFKREIVRASTVPLSSIEVYKENVDDMKKNVNRKKKKQSDPSQKEVTPSHEDAQDPILKRDGKPWCEICQKSFATVSNLSRHKMLHADSKPFPCTMCHKAYSSLTSLRKHVMAHEENSPCDRPHKYSCQQCDKSFKEKSLLKYHNIMRHGKKYTCDFCKRDFTAKGTLIPHLRLHYGDKPFICKYCEKRFTQISTLKEHERTHTGERPFPCDFCGKTFSSKSVYNVHKRKHVNLKPYTCSICSRTFTARYSLHLHQRVHTGEKPFECEICNNSFAHKNSLKRHMMLHTGQNTPEYVDSSSLLDFISVSMDGGDDDQTELSNEQMNQENPCPS